jgi:hypothetical protein
MNIWLLIFGILVGLAISVSIIAFIWGLVE